MSSEVRFGSAIDITMFAQQFLCRLSNQGLATFNPSSACPTRHTERLSALRGIVSANIRVTARGGWRDCLV